MDAQCQPLDRATRPAHLEPHPGILAVSALRIAALLSLAACLLPAPPAFAERPAPRLPSRPSRPGLDPGGQRDRLRPPPVVLPPRLPGSPRCETTTSTGAEMTLVLDAPLPGT